MAMMDDVCLVETGRRIIGEDETAHTTRTGIYSSRLMKVPSQRFACESKEEA